MSGTIAGLDLQVCEHPLVAEALGRLRDRQTDAATFRSAARLIARTLTLEATKDLPTERVRVTTPLEETWGSRRAGDVIAVPVLRAGIGLLDGFLDILPDASVGYIGLRRNETTLEAAEYYRNLPTCDDGTTFILDPMIATGGSARGAIRSVTGGGGWERLRLIGVVAAPEGLAALASEFPGLRVHVAALDRGLNERGYIVPGLGDAGDRLCRTL